MAKLIILKFMYNNSIFDLCDLQTNLEEDINKITSCQF